MKLLITQGTTAFAQRLAKRFTGQDRRARVCFASSDPIPGVLINTGAYKVIPAAGHPAFIHELLKLALDQGAGYVLPLGLDEAVALSGSKLLFSEYGIHVLVPDPEVLEGLQLLENPPRAMELRVLHGGQPLEEGPGSGNLSGVFCFTDDGEPYWCLSFAGGAGQHEND